MQHFEETAFRALAPGKAKSAALAMFNVAIIQTAPDWRGVAFALHAAFNRPKPVKALTDHASGFQAWSEVAPGSRRLRGRVTVTLADGWSRSFNMIGGMSKAGVATWAISRAVLFALTCWRLATCRRLTGSDDALRYVRPCGLEIALDALLACPEIVSIVSEDGEDSTAGELVWNPETANRETADYRSGKVAADAPDFAAAIEAEREPMIESLGYRLNYGLNLAMASRVKAIAERVSEFLSPSIVTKSREWDIIEVLRPVIQADPTSYPMDDELSRDVEEWRETCPYGVKVRGLDTQVVTYAPEVAPVEEPKSEMPTSVSQDRDGKWTTWQDGGSVPMESIFTSHVVVIQGSHRAGNSIGAKVKVIGLPYPQSGYVADISDVIDGPGKGCRISGPRSMTKLYRESAKRFELCTKAAEAMVSRLDLDFTHERFVPRHGMDYRHTRVKLMADALYAFGADDFSDVPMGRLAVNFEHENRLYRLMNCKTEPCPYSRTIKQDDLEHVWPPIAETPVLTVIANAAPLALPAPAKLLLLTGPKVKPRYRVTASGAFEKIAA